MNKKDFTKEELISMIETMDAFVTYYRNKLLEKGYTREQLRCFDVECCEQMARKELEWCGFNDEEWEKVSDLAYNDLTERGL